MARLPEAFVCSITHEAMRDPVSTSDGLTYERAAIERWFAEGHTTSPRTGAVLIQLTLTPAVDMKKAIDELISLTSTRKRERCEVAGWLKVGRPARL